MASSRISKRKVISEKERQKRKRFLNATLVTCTGIAVIGGSLHVVELGANRMEEMRSKATYDLSEMKDRIRAAGEDVARHERHEAGRVDYKTYSVAEVESLLAPEVWADIETQIAIPAGPFLMGSDKGRTSEQNRPQHRVDLPAYQMDKYPTTNIQYARFVADKGYRPPLDWTDGQIPPEMEMHPVVMVSWYDASNYCTWAGKRLPTEAEWEKAARGTDGRRWPWGEHMDAARLNTYYSVGGSTDVTTYPEGASPYGVMDMAGNVFEWTEDDFLPYRGTDASPDLFQGKKGVAQTPSDRAMKVVDLVGVDAKYKVLRGGSWKSDPFSTATYHRNYSWPHYASDFFGFRCAADTSEVEGSN